MKDSPPELREMVDAIVRGYKPERIVLFGSYARGDAKPPHSELDLLVVKEGAMSNGLADEHIAQLLGYLRACRIEHGLLINFGAPKLEIRKYALSDR